MLFFIFLHNLLVFYHKRHSISSIARFPSTKDNSLNFYQNRSRLLQVEIIKNTTL